MDHTTVEFQAQNISTEELIEFLVAKEIDPNCPACRKGTTAIQADDSGKVRFSINEFAEFDGKMLNKVPGVMHPSVMAVCNNCGYIRHFSAHRINVWLKSKDAIQDRES